MPLVTPATRNVPSNPSDAAARAATHAPAAAARTAFTLIELLVVVGIIGILVALTTVTIRVIRDHAESTRCLAGLSQYGAAALMYSSENRNYYPLGYVLDGSFDGYGGTRSPIDYWASWAGYFGDGVTGNKTIAKILACPTANRLMRVSGVASAKSRNVIYWPIGPSANKNTKTTDILIPAQTCMMVDAGQFNIQYSGKFHPADAGANRPPLMPHLNQSNWTLVQAPSGVNLNRGVGYFTKGKEVVLFFDCRAALLDLDPQGKSATAIPWNRPGLGQRRNYNLFWNNIDSTN